MIEIKKKEDSHSLDVLEFPNNLRSYGSLAPPLIKIIRAKSSSGKGTFEGNICQPFVLE